LLASQNGFLANQPHNRSPHKRMSHRFIFTVLQLLVLLVPWNVHAETQPLSKANVAIGIYPNRIHSLDLKGGSYTCSFSLWFRWTDPKLKPYESFKVRNGDISSKDESWVGMLPDGKTHLAVVDVNATFSTTWNTSEFPFDQQQLTIEIEESNDEVDELLYSADSDNMTPRIDQGIAGWNIRSIDWVTKTETYSTNYGNNSIPGDKTFTNAHFIYRVSVERNTLLQGAKLLLTPFVILMLLLMGRLMNVRRHATDRVAIGSAALFAAVATHYVITESLPNGLGISIAETCAISAIAACGWYLILTLLAVRAHEADRTHVSMVENINSTGITLILIYCVYIASTGAYHSGFA
jgi:hypothetical protein